MTWSCVRCTYSCEKRSADTWDSPLVDPALEFKRVSKERRPERFRLAGQRQGEFLRRRAEDGLPQSKPNRFELAVDVQRLDIALNDREIDPPVVDGEGRVVGGKRDDVAHVQVRIDPAAMRITIGAKRLTVLER